MVVTNITTSAFMKELVKSCRRCSWLSLEFSFLEAPDIRSEVAILENLLITIIYVNEIK